MNTNITPLFVRITTGMVLTDHDGVAPFAAYEIQHFTLADGWINVLTDENGDPVVFATHAEAEQELREFIAKSLEASANGDLIGFDPGQYRVGKRGAEGEGA